MDGWRDGEEGAEPLPLPREPLTPAGHSHPQRPAPVLAWAQPPAPRRTAAVPTPGWGRSRQTVAGAGGQSWPGGRSPYPGSGVTPRCRPRGSNAAPAALPGDPLPAEARGEPRWGHPAGTGGRWPPHSSWRGCRRSAAGDARESSRERLRHRAVRAGGTPRGRGGRAELLRTESRRIQGSHAPPRHRPCGLWGPGGDLVTPPRVRPFPGAAELQLPLRGHVSPPCVPSVCPQAAEGAEPELGGRCCAGDPRRGQGWALGSRSKLGQ